LESYQSGDVLGVGVLQGLSGCVTSLVSLQHRIFSRGHHRHLFDDTSYFTVIRIAWVSRIQNYTATMSRKDLGQES
jgi:hypothetical protein